jgi:membrane-associated phospholipid phosphatase
MQTEEKNPSSLFWKIPLIFFLVLLPFSAGIDLAIARFFVGETGRFQAPAWCWTVYRYGLRPGQCLFIVSNALLIIGILIRKKGVWNSALYISLTLFIGSGVIGHGVLKRFWQRPRPKQITLFGSTYPFCPIYTRYVGPADRHLRSLPSGHATMGFYFFSLYFLGRRTKKSWLKILGLIAACTMGGLLSWIRLYQGGHYFSDIVTSALIMWLTAYFLDRLFAKLSTEDTDVSSHTQTASAL